MRYLKSFFSILAIGILCVSCSAKKAVTPPSPTPQPAEIRDIIEIPQNLEIFANAAGKNKALLDSESQYRLYESFVRIFFGPWNMSRTSISRREVSACFKNARGYKDGSTPWTQAEWDAARANAHLSTFPSMAVSGITLRNTNLRELPFREPRFSKPTPNVRDNPFDNFQYSLLPPGTPLLLAHITNDGKWYYVECPIAGGWVYAEDVAIAGDEFKNVWQTGKYAALIRERVILPGTGIAGKDSTAGIGTFLPILLRSGIGTLSVLAPVKNSHGHAEAAEIRLSSSDASIIPMPLTPGNVAKIGNRMMGQPYGWGGMLGERDCSALTRDMFVPFGIWLPRNSAAQAKRGSVIPLTGLSLVEKENVILREGVPFLSLLGMRGHITLYIGKWKGKPAIFHNVWGLRIVKDGDDNERFVIGRAVITSITPGIELKNLYRPVTFVDRLNRLTNIGIR